MRVKSTRRRPTKYHQIVGVSTGGRLEQSLRALDATSTRDGHCHGGFQPPSPYIMRTTQPQLSRSLSLLPLQCLALDIAP